MRAIHPDISKFIGQPISQKPLTALLLVASLFLGVGIYEGRATAETLVTGLTNELVNDKTCEGTGGILAYAETKDYSLYICADVKEPSQPKHYRSVNKNGTPGVKLTAKTYNPNQGSYFEFYNGDYVYMLQIPSETIKQPVLMVEFPDGSGYEQKITKFLMRGELRSPISVSK
ncbi:hypothetical protein H6F42_12540 [Pseudanabaena sp. FACHB-1998]|uniref:hypothetical protein n=1 Tax=Pseudanabaena sp. FACHB-1998 TaxID=2692858 RepID=UPI00168151AD|nr:hypothetical protein [Pseudanabaena sp. FACHB-1998]MBD2177742.1 hypothetical protein [Pseudanabaena sp. FACHB-1998]